MECLVVYAQILFIGAVTVRHIDAIVLINSVREKLASLREMYHFINGQS